MEDRSVPFRGLSRHGLSLHGLSANGLSGHGWSLAERAGRRGTGVLLVAALALASGSAVAGYAKQETNFHLEVSPAKVGDWIEHHPADVERAAGVNVLSQRDDLVKLEKSDEHGQYVFWVRRSAERGNYREVLVETVRGGLSAEQTEIVVVPTATGGCDVTIRMTATVDDLGNVKIAVGCRRAIKGVRALLERVFGPVEQ